jgi:hypothetical protein
LHLFFFCISSTLCAVLKQPNWSAATKNGYTHGVRTPNEGINQRYLKNWADVADEICFGHT